MKMGLVSVQKKSRIKRANPTDHSELIDDRFVVGLAITISHEAGNFDFSNGHKLNCITNKLNQVFAFIKSSHVMRKNYINSDILLLRYFKYESIKLA